VSNDEPIPYSWATLILPYVEHQALYDALRPRWRFVLGTQRERALGAPLDIYRCPSDPYQETRNRHFAIHRPHRRDFRMAAGNYVISEGVAGFQPGIHECHAFSEVTDGLSETMLVGERDHARNVGAVWPAYARSSSSVGFRVVWEINLFGDQGTDFWSSCRDYALASEHVGGANVVFCDGSVCFLAEDIPAAHGGNCGTDPDDPVHCFFPANDFPYQQLYNMRDGHLAWAGPR
jgi:prepilin-type processing-associated H-X9-DG protein